MMRPVPREVHVPDEEGRSDIGPPVEALKVVVLEPRRTVMLPLRM